MRCSSCGAKIFFKAKNRGSLTNLGIGQKDFVLCCCCLYGTRIKGKVSAQKCLICERYLNGKTKIEKSKQREKVKIIPIINLNKKKKLLKKLKLDFKKNKKIFKFMK